MSARSKTRLPFRVPISAFHFRVLASWRETVLLLPFNSALRIQKIRRGVALDPLWGVGYGRAFWFVWGGWAVWKKCITATLMAIGLMSTCSGCGIFCDRYCDRQDRNDYYRERRDRSDDPCRPPPRNYDNDCR